MPIIEGWMPPTRENWELIVNIYQFSYPIVSSAPPFIPSPPSPHPALGGLSARPRFRAFLRSACLLPGVFATPLEPCVLTRIRAHAARLDSMGYPVVWHGQDVCRQPPQRPRAHRLGDHGGARLPDAALCHEYAAAERGHS